MLGKQPCYGVVSLPNLKKRGGGADGDVFISGSDLVWNVFDHTACLHRQEQQAKINKPTLYLAVQVGFN